MARKGARLYIDSDVTGVQKGVGKAQSSLRGFERDAKRSQSVMGGLTTTAGSLGLALGVGGLALGVGQSLTAFKDQERQMARVVATLKTLGVNTDAVRKKVLAVTDAQSKLSGFQDDELQASYSTILRVTKDVNRSFELNALAMDIARGSGKDLQVVALAIAKVADGNANALARYGVKAQKGATSTDVLREAQKRYAGQAKQFGDSAAGSAERADVAIDQLKQSVGGKLAPAMEEAAGATLKFSGAAGNLIDNAGGIGPLVAGGAGFGAFKLVAPSILNAGDAVAHLSRVAGKQGAGSSVRVLGSALGASVSPMAAAAAGAGILAGGIYEIWHTSENADQAVSKLNVTINGLNDALDQKRVAKDAVNSAKDYVKSTRDAEAAARARARALHGDLVELEAHKHTEAQSEAATKKWKKALEDVVPAVHARQRAETQLDGAQKNLVKSQDGVNDAAAKQNRAVRGVVTQVQGMTADVRVAGRAGLVWKNTMGDSATQAEILAGKLDKAAKSTKGTDKALSTADTNLAGFTRHINRLPTIREVKLVTRYSAQGMTLDEITRKIDGLRSKKITLTTQVNPLTGRVVTSKPTPKRTGPPFTPATGAYVAGSYAAGDRVPALLSGEEAVLNPRQIDMVDSGMSVMGALSATGAPTIGQGFAVGKRPSGKRAVDGTYGNGLVRKGGRWFYSAGGDPLDKGNWVPLPPGSPKSVAAWIAAASGSGLTPANTREDASWWLDHARGGRVYGEPWHRFAKGGKIKPEHRSPKYNPPTVKYVSPAQRMAAQVDKAIAGIQGRADLRSAGIAVQIAQADAAGNAQGNVMAYQADFGEAVSDAAMIRQILANPARALGIKGAKLTNAQRIDLLGTLASLVDRAKGDQDTIFGLQHPASDDGSGDGSAGPVDATPDPDLQAQLDQANQRAAIATRAAGLSDASLRALTSSGDIGTGGFASAFGAGSDAPRLSWSTPASTAAVASAAAQGFGLQPSVSSNRDRIAI